MNEQIKSIYEDKNILVINKPAGIKTEEFKKLRNQQFELVHRLDKDTSGVLILAKNKKTKDLLQKQFKERKVEKNYLALILGEIKPKSGTIDLPIIRSKKDPRKRTIGPSGTGRNAITSYKTLKLFKIDDEILSLIEAKPITGRTHQIRVHLKAWGNPIIGDPLYNSKISKKISTKLDLYRQFLHAKEIKILNMVFRAPLPADLKKILKCLHPI